MPTDELTTLEYALLGLIGMNPMSGYDVHRIFATTPLAHFSSSPGAIYPALRRLEKRGLLGAALDRTTEARPRRVFSLTAEGDTRLTAWLHQPVTREELIRGGAPLLRFSLGGQRLSRKELIAYLRTYRQAVQAYLEELEQYLPGMQGEHMLTGRLSLENGIAGFRSELEWTERAMEELGEGRPVRVGRASARPKRPGHREAG